MVKVGKIWGDAKFASLSPISKLLYCYLVTQPSISTLGVIRLDVHKIHFDLKTGMEDIPNSLDDLKGDYIEYFIEDKLLVIVVKNHYKSLPRSKANIRKAIDEAKKSNKNLQDIFRELFTGSDFEGKNSFTPPTPSEVTEYAHTLGYLVSGKDFVNYYADNDWYDKNDKKVRNWKSKLSKVWCRETNKLKTADGAPKGFEYFFVDTEEGDRIFPESWKGGLPSHSNYIYAQYLIEEFNEQRDS